MSAYPTREEIADVLAFDERGTDMSDLEPWERERYLLPADAILALFPPIGALT